MSLNLPATAGMVTRLSYLTLVLQQGLDCLVHQQPWFLWAIKLLPLLMFLPGMIRDNLRSYIWLCFVCLGYFLILVQRMFADPSSLLVIAGMAAVVVLFTAAMMYVRWRAQELRAQEES